MCLCGTCPELSPGGPPDQRARDDGDRRRVDPVLSGHLRNRRRVFDGNPRKLPGAPLDAGVPAYWQQYPHPPGSQGPRADVIFDTGTGNTPHNANGIGWYFNDSFSWGFADEGDTIYRNSCDTDTSGNNDQRLCWHTGNVGADPGELGGGYRCGATDFLNDSTDWERIIYIGNEAVSTGIPALSWLGLGVLGFLLTMLAGWRIRRRLAD